MENPDALIASAKRGMQQINTMLQTNPATRAQYVNLSRQVMQFIDRGQLMTSPNHLEEQVWILESMQNCLNGDTNNTDCILWCETQWNRILGSHPNNLSALQGLGRCWLSKASPTLVRINLTEASLGSTFRRSSSSTEGGPAYSGKGKEREEDAEADRLRHTHDYVEARVLLLPAKEFLTRAVAIAKQTGKISGNLLALHAEASIQLGNVSYHQDSLRHFEDAVRSLREASAFVQQGYRLPEHLAKFLGDYERYV